MSLSFDEDNIFKEHVSILGLWDSPNVPGLSQDLGTLPKTSKSVFLHIKNEI